LRGEDLAPSWFWFRLWFRRLLGFFSTFIFASHDKKHDTKRAAGKSQKLRLFLPRQWRSV